MDAEELLGLPLIPAFSQVSNSRDQMARGINFAYAASGILDITGQNFENGDLISQHEDILLILESMGFSVEEASAAMERCGPDASVAELSDFIFDAQMAKT